MTDVFDEPPTIVDGDLLEAAKENIQPLAKGRRVTTLASVLSTPHAQRESRLSAARNRHRINIEVAMEDEDDDPLEAYCRFVDWTVENYPQGHSAESGLLELLEEATRVLKDDRGGKWRDDIRYLKLWVLYANYVEKPAIIYKFCLVNDIGTSHSLLYEEHATVLERASRRAEADEVYLLGIARKASPLERLENKHREFQKRMMASINLSPPANEPPAASSSSSSGRPALAEAASSSSSTARTRASRSGSTRAPPGGDIFSPSVNPTPAARPNGRIPIFVDPSGDAENDPEQAAPWPELGTRTARIKENIPEVRKAQGTTLRQSGRTARSGGGTSRIAVYRDPEPGAVASSEEMPPPPVPSSKKEKGKSSIPVFRDEDASEASGPSGVALKKEKAKSSIAVFRDEDAVDTSAPSAAPAGKKPDKGKSTIAVFRDEERSEKDVPATPSTPSFTPYRDEEPATPSSSNVSHGVMKPKPRREALGLTESEALRRDPLKNYAPEDRPTED
ncbi:hypothetical protein DAEQUDRAFT_814365 [Daedalea quercina L-15889]|uniref:BUB1 N-terminal domain-containing protein n=1 Tax=Daedalea quercina L-15889 TaxID=1314783 RepID=A0A165M6Q0_9APHY|nr:hypothetical protein DAEQUDRAFT_814365 [Daedalea quercina L-15889]